MESTDSIVDDSYCISRLHPQSRMRVLLRPPTQIPPPPARGWDQARFFAGFCPGAHPHSPAFLPRASPPIPLRLQQGFRHFGQILTNIGAFARENRLVRPKSLYTLSLGACQIWFQFQYPKMFLDSAISAKSVCKSEWSSAAPGL